jgi:hypothetical protein
MDGDVDTLVVGIDNAIGEEDGVLHRERVPETPHGATAFDTWGRRIAQFSCGLERRKFGPLVIFRRYEPCLSLVRDCYEEPRADLAQSVVPTCRHSG